MLVMMGLLMNKLTGATTIQVNLVPNPPEIINYLKLQVGDYKKVMALMILVLILLAYIF